MKHPSLLPIALDNFQLASVHNIKPSTYPAEAMDPSIPTYAQLIKSVPKKAWEGDWIIEQENDIAFLAKHFQSQPDDFMWVREKHRFKQEDQTVICQYQMGEDKKTTIHPSDVPFFDRWLPPIGMLRDASRFCLLVKSVDVEWANEKRTDMIWKIGIMRVAEPDLIFHQFNKRK